MQNAGRAGVVVITGAAGGLGRALVREYCSRGFALALTDQRGPELEAVAEECTASGALALAWPCDLADQPAVAALFAQLQDQLSTIDVLILNAGITHIGRFAKSEPVHRLMAVNFFGAVHCAEAALPTLCENKGRIIAISSVAGFAPLLGRTAYAASKHALHGFFGSLRTELVDRGVDVTLVCPSEIDTPIQQAALGALGAEYARNVPGKMSPEYVARAIAACPRSTRTLRLGRPSHLAYWTQAIAPSLYDRGMRKRYRALVP